MNNLSYLSYIQPNIVKFKNNDKLPEQIRNQFCIQMNIPNLAIKGGIPAVYIIIDKSMFNNSYDNKIIKFMNKYLTTGGNVLFVGINNFQPGKQYFINEIIYENRSKIIDNNIDYGSFDFGSLDFGSNDAINYFIEDYDNISINNVLPNSFDNGCFNSKYFDDIAHQNTDLFNTVNKYFNRNAILNTEFTEEDINNFYSTFCALILTYTEINEFINVNNQIYKQVLTFYKNLQNDNTLISLNLIFNKMFTINTQPNLNCGCSTNHVDSEALCSQKCSGYYQSAMLEYLKQMFGDYNFYYDWISYINEDNTISGPNIVLIDKLIELIMLIVNGDYNIDKSIKQTNDCTCPQIVTNICNRDIMLNYVKVLNWVRNNEIEENINKIKIFGQQFAELLPTLQF